MSLCIANRIMNEYVSQDTLLHSVDESDYNLSFDSINDEQEYRQRLSLEFKRRLSEGTSPVNPLLKLSQEELAKLKQLYDYEIAYEDYDSDNYDTYSDINEDNKDQEEDDEEANDNNNNYNKEEEEEEAIFELEV